MSVLQSRRGVVVAVVAAFACLAGVWIVLESRGRAPQARDGDAARATADPTLAAAPARPQHAAPPRGTEVSPPTSEPPPRPAESTKTAVEGVVVLASDGAPVVGATVTVWDENEDESLAPPVSSDDDGRFRVVGVPAARPLVVTAVVAGRVSVALRVERDGATRGLRIEVPVGGTVTGIVTDGDGRPMEGVRVFVARPREPVPPRGLGGWEMLDEEHAVSRRRLAVTRTDAAGRYVLRGIPVRQERVVVAQATHTLEARSEPFAPAADGESITRDVRVPKPASARVVVEGLGTGSPADVDIELQGPLVWERFGKDVLREDGTWIAEGLTPGTYTVNVFAGAGRIGRAEVTLVEGQRTQITVRLPAGLSVEGVVVTEAGEPVGHASVVWEGARNAITSAGPDGRFRFEGLEGGAGRLIADGHGMPGLHGEPPPTPSAKTTLEGVAPGGPPIRIVLRASPVVVGRIVGAPAGAPVDTSVFTRDLSAGSGLGPLPADGAFTVPTQRIGVPAFVVLKIRGSAPLVIDVPPLAAGARHDVGTLRVDAGRTLLVDVRDEAGKPVAGATVTITDTWAERRASKTAPDGTARFDAMPARGMEVAVRAAGFPLHVVSLPPPGTVPAAVVLGKGSILEGTVLDAKGQPVAEANVSIRPDGEYPYDVSFDVTRQSLETDAAGRFRARLQARGYRVIAWAADYGHRTETDVAVAGDATTTVAIRLR
jgi:hypothetical protein